MPYSMHLLLTLATLPGDKGARTSDDEQAEHGNVQEVLAPVLEKIAQRSTSFVSSA